MSNGTMLGVPLRKRQWVKSPDGEWHAAFRSDGEHHSAYCGKYVKGEAKHHEWSMHLCSSCRARLMSPVRVTEEDAEEEPDRTPRCVALGAGLKSTGRGTTKKRGGR